MTKLSAIRQTVNTASLTATDLLDPEVLSEIAADLDAEPTAESVAAALDISVSEMVRICDGEDIVSLVEQAQRVL